MRERKVFAQTAGIQIQVDLKPKCVLFPRRQKTLLEGPTGGRECVHQMHYGRFHKKYLPWALGFPRHKCRWEALGGGPFWRCKGLSKGKKARKARHFQEE